MDGTSGRLAATGSLLGFFDGQSLKGGPSVENMLRANRIRASLSFATRAPHPAASSASQHQAVRSGGSAPSVREAVEAAALQARVQEKVPCRGSTEVRRWACRRCGHAFGLRRTCDLHERRCGSSSGGGKG